MSIIFKYTISILIFISSQCIAEEPPAHCHKSIFKGYGVGHDTSLAKKSARATWRANVLRESGLFKGLDDIIWTYAKNKSYSCSSKWGIKYCTAKARPCSALQE